jgi:cytochrome c oxidase subunit III
MGMWLTLASIFMLFAGLVTAYAFALSRQALWKPVRIPPEMWLSTMALALSSIVLQVARYSLRRGRLGAYANLLFAATGLGGIFLVSQMLAWSDLARQGVYMKGNPHGSMWFAFTGFHAAHVTGGMIAMSMLLYSAGRLREQEGEPPLRRHRNFAALTAMYWHFMGVLWVGLFGLLQWWN